MGKSCYSGAPLYGQFRLSRQKAHIFSLKSPRLYGHRSIRTTDIFLCPESQTLTPLYGQWLSAHCLFSLSQRLYNHSSKQLMLQIPPKMVVVVAGGH